MTRTSLFAVTAVLSIAAIAGADWFDVPGARQPATAPAAGRGAAAGDTGAAARPSSRSELPARSRNVDAALCDHAVYFARADLGIGQERIDAAASRLAQNPSVVRLPSAEAFLAGGRFASRVRQEMDRLTVPARAAAAKALADAAEYHCTLPLAAGAGPRDAAVRLEQAIYAANLAIRAQGVRLDLSAWLEDSLKPTY